VEGPKLIALPDSGKDSLMMTQWPGRGTTLPQPHKDALHDGDEELPCFATSSVYQCTNNSCSAYQRCAQAVSPWTPS